MFNVTYHQSYICFILSYCKVLAQERSLGVLEAFSQFSRLPGIREVWKQNLSFDLAYCGVHSLNLGLKVYDVDSMYTSSSVRD